MINGWNDVETSHVLGYNACTKKPRKNKKPGDTSFLQMEVSKKGVPQNGWFIMEKG
jgi:hypothetical protein